jgi:hydrogenase maturation protease
MQVEAALPQDETEVSPGRVIIAGVGNRLVGDEGVGPRVIDHLSQMRMPPYVQVLDCGCDLLSIVLYVDRPEKIVVVDAIRAGGEPGRVYRFDYGELAAAGDRIWSAHQVGTVDALRLLRFTCAALASTEIVVIGAEPKTMELNAGLSKEIKKSIPELTRLALEEISAPCLLQTAIGMGAGVSLDPIES